MIPRPGEVTHITVVVKDLRKTMETYRKIFGWEPWEGFVLKAPKHYETMLRGKPVHFSMEAASTMVGPVNYEIIQPLEGKSAYTEWLDRHGEGFQHISYWHWLSREDTDSALKHFEQMGISVLMSGKIKDGLQYYYMDSDKDLKVHVEIACGKTAVVKPDWVYPKSRIQLLDS